MLDLDSALTPYLKGGDFEIYLNELETLEISQNLLPNEKNKSMYRAYRTWMLLSRDIAWMCGYLTEQVLPRLQFSSGQSVDTIKDELKQYIVWLEEIAKAFDKMSQCVNKAENAYTSAAACIVQPSRIINSFALLKSLESDNTFGTQTPLITALEARHKKWRIHNIATMMEYHQEAAVAAAELPTFPEPLASASLLD